MSNPEQSKHLETARMKLLDFELDLVNLRSETYSDSRIPQMTIGTPIQDAERRDLTINSLFYNINTNEVGTPSFSFFPGLICFLGLAVLSKLLYYCARLPLQYKSIFNFYSISQLICMLSLSIARILITLL